MTTASEVQEDIGYQIPYHLQNTPERKPLFPKQSENKTLAESRSSLGKLVRIQLIRGMHNGQIVQMAAKFADDLIKRNYAVRV